jgi:organic radical activating enzyme
MNIEKYKIKKIIKKTYTGKVYNFGTRIHHNYFANSILVHNCHENSDKSGKHAILENYYFILEQLPAGAELAIGGGNPLDHPNLITFLEKAKKEGIICNITVNELHLKKFKNLITKLVNEDLIKGLGITYSGRQKKELEYFSKLTNNLVFHVIMGVHELSCLDEIQKYSNKVLILGYKEFRKGKDFYSEEVENKKYKWYTRLPIYFNKMTLSFDNLAIEQLNLKRWLTNESWNKFYMGDDSTFTMYIDAVENKFASSSTHKDRFSVEPDIRKIFNKIKKEVI